MLKKRTMSRVIFNDSHSNLPSNSYIPQGGVASFAKVLSINFHKNYPDIKLISLLFSDNTKNNKIYTRKTTSNSDFYELVYDRKQITESYKRKYTLKEYTKFLKPWIEELNNLFEQAKPDIVFLNGFSLSNWLILEVAYKRKVPVCIQHAGIWKKELNISQKHFSPSVKKIFSNYEKDIFRKASHQIFLNEFSRDIFFSIHNIPKNKKTFSKTSIVPLPIEIKKLIKINIANKKHYNIGIVARWDGIKNHDAILRLAKYIKKNNLPMTIKVVTGWGAVNKITKYKEEYQKFIQIINPMSPEKLKNFYKSQDIIIIPSRFDVSPTVLMEAITCGKPVIISDNVGWISDYHKFNLDKLIIDFRASGENIYKTISELIKNKQIYIKKFEKMQQKIINKHNPHVIFKEYYNVFKKLS